MTTKEGKMGSEAEMIWAGIPDKEVRKEYEEKARMVIAIAYDIEPKDKMNIDLVRAISSILFYKDTEKKALEAEVAEMKALKGIVGPNYRFYVESAKKLEAENANLKEEVTKLFQKNSTAREVELEAEVADLKEANKILAQQGDKDFHDRVRLEAENAKLKEFAQYVLNNSFLGYDTDGGSAQDEAESLGLIELRPIKPEDSIDGETEHYFTKWMPK